MEFVAFSKFYNFLPLIIMYLWIKIIYLAFCVPALAMGAPAKQPTAAKEGTTERGR